MTPIRAIEPYDWAALLGLIQSAFREMDGRINPPSSMYSLTLDSIARQAEMGEIWVVEDQGPVACVFLTKRADHIYMGKLATAFGHRGQGLAVKLIAKAEERARALSRPELRLETRIELTENQTFFTRHGFKEIARTSHPGYDLPTSITMCKPL